MWPGGMSTTPAIVCQHKHNHGFKGFMLRGKQKVTIETGLLALAHNLRKKAFQNIKKAA